MSLLVTYLVKASLMYLLCFLLYWGLFRKETFFIRNRVFLLISLIFPALIPLIRLPSDSAVADLMPEVGIDRILIVPGSSPVTLPDPAVSGSEEMGAAPTPFPWETIALWMYLSGTLFFLLRMLWGYSGIIRLIIRSERKRLEDMILVITQRKVSPFSIFRWLVIPSNKLEHADLDKIIRHERVHFRQLHSVDLLLSELFVAFQWFNPFAWMLRSSIIRNNEFFVDRKCLLWYNDAKSYQYALLASSLGERRIAMANSFNQGIIKKRIEMMNRKNTRLINRIKDLLIVPFALLLIVAFSAYSGKPAQAVSDTPVTSVSASQQMTDLQDQVVEKDTTKRLTIFINGHKLTITDLNSAKSFPGNVRIFKNSGDMLTELSKDTLINLLQTNVNKEATLILIEGDDKEETVGIWSANDTSDIGTRDAILESRDGRIEIRTGQGRARMAFWLDKGDSGITIRLSKDGKGKEMLFMVDGKEIKPDEWTLSDSDQIDTISILNSDAAVKVYGEKGKNGVVVVTIKK